MKILITGSNGLLGQKIIKQLIKNKKLFLATSLGENRNPACPNEKYESLDISDQSEVDLLLQHFRPDAIIHTAAMTNVDDCELNPTACHLINVIATEYLFNAAINIGAHFTLLSTDFVFDGLKGNYSESDATNPLSVYAESKVDAEITDDIQGYGGPDESHPDFNDMQKAISYSMTSNLTTGGIRGRKKKEKNLDQLI